jgi:hypothetical protein
LSLLMGVPGDLHRQLVLAADQFIVKRMFRRMRTPNNLFP